MDMDLSSFSTLSIAQQHAVIQDHVDRKIAAAAQEETFVTHAREEAKKEKAQAQDKELRSTDDSSHANPIVLGITNALQAIQVQQQQQVAANSQAGAFRISHSSVRPAIFITLCIKGQICNRRL